MVLGVFFDLEKAHNTTWRLGIHRRLHSLGLLGQLPTFLQRLLLNGSFQVRVSSVYSRPFILEESIPQDSVLSTILFLVGFNDIVS